MDTDEIRAARKSGSIGGNITLELYGRTHFSKAANTRWKKYRLEKAAKQKKAIRKIKKQVHGIQKILKK